MLSPTTYGRLGVTALLGPILLTAALADTPSGTASVRSQTAAIAFDQIDRILIQGATPPPVGSFEADAATIASLPPLDTGMKKLEESQKAAMSTAGGSMLMSSVLGMIPIVGGLIAAGVAHAANAAAQANLQQAIDENNATVMHIVNAGKLSRYAFYHGWLRVERVGQDVTIRSADGMFTMVLDVTNKTARTTDDRTAPETYEVSSDTTAAAPTIEKQAMTEKLPDANVSGLRARGYRTTATLVLPRAVAWCAPGRHTVTQVEYVVDRADPQTATPIPKAQQLADGCSPSSTASYREPGRLVVYRATSIDAETRVPISIMFERGNIRSLGATSMSLFSIPSDFTKEP